MRKEIENKRIKSKVERSRKRKQLEIVLAVCAIVISVFVGWKLVLPAIAMNHQDVADTTETQEAQPIITPDTNADAETAEDWEKTFADVELTGKWGEDVVAIAQTQKDYKESDVNIKVAEDETINGYTRYGAFISDPYQANWDVAFVEFCLHYANVDEKVFPVQFKDLEDLKKQLEETSYYKEDSAMIPQAGDIIILQKKNQESANQFGIVTGVVEKEDTTTIYTIEGNCDNQVKVNEYQLGSEDILGYALVNEAYLSVHPEEVEGTETVETEAAEVETEETVDTTENTENNAEKPEQGATVTGTLTTNEDGTVTQTAVGNDYTVSATYDLEAKLDGAVLQIREILSGTEEYQKYYDETVQKYMENNVLKDAKEPDLTGTRFFDIKFIRDGEEIEPEVAINVNISYEKPIQSDDCQVIHFGDEETELITPEVSGDSDKNETSEVQFEAGAFSVYGIVNQDVTDTRGTANVVKVDTNHQYEDTTFYKEGPLGIIGGFHLVGFDYVCTKAHTNGNILANTLIYQSNFGCKVDEVSYVRNIEASGTISSTYNDRKSILVVGNGVNIGTADNGNAWTLNGNKVDAPGKQNHPDSLWQDTADCKFIDLEAVEEQSKIINQNLKNYTTTFGVTHNYSDQNDLYITIAKAGEVNVYNMNADEIDSNYRSNQNLKIKGFEKGKLTTLVINVDLKGKPDYVMPASWVYYTDGSQQAAGEVTKWEDGNVVWNFYDSSQSDGCYRGTIRNEKAACGLILAPEATVNLNQNFNGSVIADKINVNAESHRCDFTGPDIYPYSVTVNKKWEGATEEEIANMSVTVELSDQSGKSYGTAVLNKANGWQHVWTKLPEKVTWTVREIQGPAGYTSTTIQSGNTFTITNTKQKTTTITVEKKWKDQNGNDLLEMEANKHDGIQVELWKKVQKKSLTTNLVNMWNEGSKIQQESTQYTKGSIIHCTLEFGSSYDFKWFNYIKVNGAEVKYEKSILNNLTKYEFYITLNDDTTVDCVVGNYDDSMKDNNGNPWPKWSVSTQLINFPTLATENQKIDTVTLNSSNNWNYKWTNLPEGVYFVKEITKGNYITSYSNNNTDGIEAGIITITNTVQEEQYTLPETGGIGTTGYITGGMIMMLLSAILFYGYNLRNQRERRKKY